MRVTTLRAVPSTALMWTYRVSGEYICEGHNSEGRAQHSFNVDVQGKWEYICEGHNSEGRAQHSFNVDVQGKCVVHL